MRYLPALFAIGSLASLEGCIGYDAVGFFTNDNLGINIQATPNPVAEVSFARREGVLEPQYENGAAPAVGASVRHEIGDLWHIGDQGNALFAGGNAARYLAGAPDDPNNSIAAVACVSQKPPNVREGSIPSTLVFSTDTSIGFKVAFPAGTTVDFPNASLGYKRTEMALAGVSGRPNGCNLSSGDPKAVKDTNSTYGVYSPSFLAVARNSASGPSGGSPNAGQFAVGQVFATGAAAELLSRTPGVRGALADAAVSDIVLSGLSGTAEAASPEVKARQKQLNLMVAQLDATHTAAVAAALGLKSGATNADIQNKINATTTNSGLDQLARSLISAI
jgi:hypothetical protein